MKRRDTAYVLLLLGPLPQAGFSQALGRVWRVGYLAPNPTDSSANRLRFGSFQQRLRELGYVQGKNLILEFRSTGGDDARLGELISELLRAKVDVLVTGGSTPATVAAKLATLSVPIVFAASADPVGAGLVQTLSRPGGNVTGLSLFSPELGTKRLQLLRDFIPKLKRVSVLFNGSNPVSASQRKEIADAGASLGTQLDFIDCTNLGDLEAHFDRLAKPEVAGVKAAMCLQDPFFLTHRDRILALINTFRIALITPWSEMTDAGALISYGPEAQHLFVRAADYVDRILNGANPASLPVEQPTLFELVVNAITAKSLALQIPRYVASRADRVIE